jgi:S1-C subfamily serine protease
MSVRLIVVSALTAVAAFPAAGVAQERQPMPRARVYIDGDGPQVLRQRLKAVTERRARLGVTVDLRPNDNDSLGATLTSVTPGGPAAKAGLRSGDVITRLDGKSLTARDNKDNMKVDEDQSLPGLRLVELAAQLKPEQTVSIEYFRSGAKRTASLVTGDEIVTMNIFPEGAGDFRFGLPDGFSIERSPFPGGMLRSERLPGGGMSYAFAFGGPLADLELAPLNPDLGQYFGTAEGVLVINVPKESTLGLKGGDVILGVDGRKASGPNSLLRILRSYDPGDSFKFDIMRNRARTTVTGTLEKPKDN